MEVRAAGIALISSQNLVVVGRDGQIKQQAYHPAPQLPGLLRALYRIQSVRAGLYGAAASSYGDAFAQASILGMYDPDRSQEITYRGTAQSWESFVKAFRTELEGHKTTKNFLQVPYNESLPEDLIRRIAEYSVRAVRERKDDAFW